MLLRYAASAARKIMPRTAECDASNFKVHDLRQELEKITLQDFVTGRKLQGANPWISDVEGRYMLPFGSSSPFWLGAYAPHSETLIFLLFSFAVRIALTFMTGVE